MQLINTSKQLIITNNNYRTSNKELMKTNKIIIIKNKNQEQLMNN